MINSALDDNIRWALLAVLLPGMAAAMRHRLRAARAGDRLDRRQEGLFILIALRGAGLALWLAMIAWMVRPTLFAWSALDLPEPVRWPACR